MIKIQDHYQENCNYVLRSFEIGQSEHKILGLVMHNLQFSVALSEAKKSLEKRLNLGLKKVVFRSYVFSLPQYNKASK